MKNWYPTIKINIYIKFFENNPTKVGDYNYKFFIKIIKERVNEIENKKEYNHYLVLNPIIFRTGQSNK